MTPCCEHRTWCTEATVLSSPEFWCCPQLDWSFMRMQRLRRCELQWAFYNTPRSNIGLRTRANTCDANTCTGNYDRCLHLLWRFAHHDLWHQACGLLYSGRKWIVKSTTVFILAYDMPTHIMSGLSVTKEIVFGGPVLRVTCSVSHPWPQLMMSSLFIWAFHRHFPMICSRFSTTVLIERCKMKDKAKHCTSGFFIGLNYVQSQINRREHPIWRQLHFLRWLCRPWQVRLWIMILSMYGLQS